MIATNIYVSCKWCNFSYANISVTTALPGPKLQVLSKATRKLLKVGLLLKTKIRRGCRLHKESNFGGELDPFPILN